MVVSMAPGEAVIIGPASTAAVAEWPGPLLPPPSSLRTLPATRGDETDREMARVEKGVLVW